MRPHDRQRATVYQCLFIPPNNSRKVLRFTVLTHQTFNLPACTAASDKNILEVWLCRLNWLNLLRHFVHQSSKFYRRWKVQNLVSIFDTIHLWVYSAFEIKQHIWNSKHSLRAPIINVCFPKFGKVRFAQLWDPIQQNQFFGYSWTHFLPIK